MPHEVIHISSQSTDRHYWRDCWRYRELLFFLARRDLVVRYRQTLAGVLWLLARPAAQVATFSIVFGSLAGLESDQLPYPVLVMSGVLLWQFFSSIVQQSTIALTNNRNLVTKVYFPRLLLPIGTVAPNLVDLSLNSVVLAILMVVYRVPTQPALLLAPFAILVVGLAAVGIGSCFAAGCARYRDFRQLTPFVLQFLFLLSPVGFSTTAVQERFHPVWQEIYYLNPLAGGIDALRACLFVGPGQPPLDLARLAVAALVALLLFIGGVWYFKRSERYLADVI